MFNSCRMRVTSESVDVVPASMDMAFTPISTPATCVIPILALLTFRWFSPSSMLSRALIATSVAAGSRYSQKAMPCQEIDQPHCQSNENSRRFKLTRDSSVLRSWTRTNALSSPKLLSSSRTCSVVR